MINLHPYLNGSTQFRVGLQYTDCGGNWGYGVAVDNIRIKEGDDFTWLTVSPYSGTADLGGSAHDSINVKIGMYGVYDGLWIEVSPGKRMTLLVAPCHCARSGSSSPHESAKSQK